MSKSTSTSPAPVAPAEPDTAGRTVKSPRGKGKVTRSAIRRAVKTVITARATTPTQGATPAPPPLKAKVAARTPAAPPPPPGPSAKVRQTAELLKQAADPTRLQVLLLLAEGERNVTEICAALGSTSQPAVSHHLALCRHGRLIEPKRSGKFNVYSLTDEGRKLAEAVRGLVGSR